MIHWHDLHHSELDVPTLYAVLQLRCAVFVVEQTCAYQDIDGDDLVGENRHILGWHHGRLVAYARILKSDNDFEPVVIGRVIVDASLRGEKLGQQLMSQTLASCLQHCLARRCTLAPRRTCRRSISALALRPLPGSTMKTAFPILEWPENKRQKALPLSIFS